MTSIEKFGTSNQEQQNQQTQKEAQFFNSYKSNIQVDKREHFIEYKPFHTNQTLNNQAHFPLGISMNLNNSFQIKQNQKEIEQSRKEKEIRIQDLKNVAQKAVQRRKEKVLEKYLQPNQNIIDDYL
ncbi:unnamed protein product (macronuclear) [Paramecium tetraurelia]|uniref:Uncharacterized protein n=1 Tax=Paramecium tetraurelia TaxID=5888 RepID=A0C7V5_PARTE|nr:uncharacterized protein GSPATT00036003001 [Paramecium tetraurelia]CAK66872.1 unnamed protein product [Paramecium tetraurelia]|eukprot:XP_001434269.1 hypothetical protein (macronuclear) [Paramecium tetraurelia strain d4-2]